MVKEFVALRSSLRCARRLRPWLAVWRGLDGILDHLHSAALAYLEAISSNRPSDAQRAAEAGQSAVDAATAVAADLTPRLERANRLQDGSDPSTTLMQLAAEVRRASTGADIFDIEAAGGAILTLVTGLDECPVGVGFTVAVADVVADVVLDRDAFWQLVASIHQALSSRTSALEALVRNPRWQRDMQDATQRLFDSAVAQHAVAVVGKRERDYVRAALTLSQDLLEGPAGRYLATMVAVLRRGNYDQIRRRDSTALLGQVRQLGAAGLVDGLNEGLRHARAHEDFRVENDRVVLTNHGDDVRELSFEDFSDAVLRAVETTLALQVGITCAGAHVGLALDTLDVAKAIEIPVEDKIAFVAAIAGWEQPCVERDGTQLTVRGKTDMQQRTLRDAAMITPYLDDDIEVLKLVDQEANALREMKGPVEPFRRQREARGELEQGSTFLETAHLWTLDGKPVVAMRYIEKWVAMELATALSLPSAERTRRVKALQRFARRVDNQSLASRLQNILAVLRSTDLGLPLSDSEHDALDWFSEREKEQLSDPFS